MVRHPRQSISSVWAGKSGVGKLVCCLLRTMGLEEMGTAGVTLGMVEVLSLAALATALVTAAQDMAGKVEAMEVSPTLSANLAPTTT
jgi:hypothetical protein